LLPVVRAIRDTPLTDQLIADPSSQQMQNILVR
jgi:hypothetical protein